VSEERKLAEETGQIDDVEQSDDTDEGEASQAEVEVEARLVGWIPESEWVGPPPKYGFVDAQTFLEKGETIVPILNAKLKDARATLDSFIRLAAKASEFMAAANARTLKERDNAVAELKQAREKAAEEGGMFGKPMLDKAAQRTREAFAHMFEEYRSTSPVETTSWRRSAKSKQKGYDNLPGDAKAICDDFIAGGIMTQEEYVNNYEWDE
jgi:hypothetical protein